MIRSLPRLGFIAAMLALAVAASACSQTAPSPSMAPSTSTAPSVEPSATVSVAPSSSVSEEPQSLGIALADVDITLLEDAFKNYSFTFDEPAVEGDQTFISGYDASGEVQVVLSGPTPASGELLTPTQVAVYDFSAGTEGLDEMGFALGIFAPESQSWLVDQISTAMSQPGVAFEASKDFEFVTMTVNAFTDDSQSIDLIIN